LREVQTRGFAEGQSGAQLQGTAGDHLHGHGEERGIGFGGVSRIHGTHSPRHGGEDQRSGPGSVNDAMTELIFTGDDQGYSDEADGQANPHDRPGARAFGAKPIHEDDP
jgi:hypothetical protein